MTYQKLIDYLAKITENKPPDTVKKRDGKDDTEWSCKHCLPFNEYYHCLYYIKRKINDKYLGIEKKGTSIANNSFLMGDVFVDVLGNVFKGDESGEAIKIGRISKYSSESYTDKVCNSCKFVPEYPTHCKKLPSNDCYKNKNCENENCNKKNCFLYFMNCTRKAEDFNKLFGNVNSYLTTWICIALGLKDELDLSLIEPVKLVNKGWILNICGKDENIKDKKFTEKFWEERLLNSLPNKQTAVMI